jgi:hypothetical protein
MKGKVLLRALGVVAVVALAVVVAASGVLPPFVPQAQPACAAPLASTLGDVWSQRATSPGWQPIGTSYSAYPWLPGTSLGAGTYIVTLVVNSYILGNHATSLYAALFINGGQQNGEIWVYSDQAGSGEGKVYTSAQQWVITVPAGQCYYFTFRFRRAGGSQVWVAGDGNTNWIIQRVGPNHGAAPDCR